MQGQFKRASHHKTIHVRHVSTVGDEMFTLQGEKHKQRKSTSCTAGQKMTWISQTPKVKRIWAGNDYCRKIIVAVCALLLWLPVRVRGQPDRFAIGLFERTAWRWSLCFCWPFLVKWCLLRQADMWSCGYKTDCCERGFGPPLAAVTTTVNSSIG